MIHIRRLDGRSLTTDGLLVLPISVILRLATLAVQAFIARNFAVADFNLYITASVIGALASLGSDLGLTSTVVFAARGDGASARLIVAWLQRRRLLSAAVCWLMGTACVALLRHGVNLIDLCTAALLVAGYVGQGYSRYFRAPLLAEQRPIQEASLEFLDRSLAVLAALPAMFFTRQLICVALAQAVGTAAGYLLVRRVVSSTPWRPLAWSRSALLYGVRLSLAVVASQLYARLDYLILSEVSAARRTAVYAAAYNMVLGFSLLPIALTRVANSHLTKRDLNAHAHRDYIVVALSSGLLGGLAIATVGPLAVRLLFRLDDEQLAPLCVILGVAFVFMSINSTIGVLGPRAGRETQYLAVVGAALIVNVASCLALIPSMGLLGGGVATTVTELCVTVFWWRGRSHEDRNAVRQPPAVSVIDS